MSKSTLKKSYLAAGLALLVAAGILVASCTTDTAAGAPIDTPPPISDTPQPPSDAELNEIDLSAWYGEQFTYGQDAALDALWNQCLTDDAACDALFFAAPVRTGYSEFASDCGGRGREHLWCQSGDPIPGQPFTIGDDAEFDALMDSCAGGDLSACDSLATNAPAGSDYYVFGAMCGGRGRTGSSCR